MSRSLHIPGRATRDVAVLALALVVAQSCSCPSEDPGQLLREIEQLEQRRAGPRGRLAELLRHRRPELRARAALAAGRLGLALPELEPLVADPVARVRREAAFGLGLLVADTPAGLGQAELARRVEPVLRRRLGQERDARVRQALLGSLGWVMQGAAGREVERLLEPAVAPETRDAALRALVVAGHRGRLRLEGSLGDRLRRALAAPRAETRLLAAQAAAHAAGRCPDALLRALLAAGEDPETGVRRWAVRAVGAHHAAAHIDWLARRLHDHRPEVQAAAAQALGQAGLPGARQLAKGLRPVWRSVSANHFRLTGAELHPVLAGLAALEAHARQPEVHQLAQEILELADATDAAVTYQPKEAHSVDLVHCAAARLWDLGVGALERTPRCGTAGSKQLHALRRESEAALIGRLGQGQALAPYLEDRVARVRAAAQTALPLLPALSSVPGWLLRGLEDTEPAVVAAAARATAALAHRFDAGQRQRLGGATVARLRGLAAKVARHPAAICALADALATLRVDAAAAALRSADVLGAPLLGVRACAGVALARLTGKAPGTVPTAPSGAVGEPPPTEKLPTRAKVVTDHGVIQLRLLVDEAPLTVAHFARLVRAGAYKGAEIRRVAPGAELVVGAPGGQVTVPCELSPAPVDRGSVSLALDGGRDSGSADLVITLERRPERDGRHTRFAQVLEGLPVLEQLQLGDVILGIYLAG